MVQSSSSLSSSSSLNLYIRRLPILWLSFLTLTCPRITFIHTHLNIPCIYNWTSRWLGNALGNIQKYKAQINRKLIYRSEHSIPQFEIIKGILLCLCSILPALFLFLSLSVLSLALSFCLFFGYLFLPLSTLFYHSFVCIYLLIRFSPTHPCSEATREEQDPPYIHSVKVGILWNSLGH